MRERTSRVAWGLIVALVFVSPAVGFIAGLSLNPSGPDRAAAGDVKGNVDCDSHVDVEDAARLLMAIADVRGAPGDCVVATWVPPVCPSPVSPTDCDTPVAIYITQAPGEPLHERFDLDCDGHVDATDVIYLIRYVSYTGIAMPTECAPIGL